MALHARAQPVQRTPLPWKELSVIIVVLTTESTSFQYLFPFVPFMVRGFGVVEENVGFYSGWIASSFMVGQFFSSFFWGRMSDVVGLKPVMLIGMTFTAITTVLFGLSHSLEWALTVRFIGGLFNGVIGVTKTYIGLITDETNEAQAFGFMALCWGAGGILGPAIGGLLCQPADKYPAVFPPGSLWGEYPFLLPCLVTAMIPTAGFFLAVTRLTEPDRGKRPNAQAIANQDKEMSSSTTSSAASSTTATAAATAADRQLHEGRATSASSLSRAGSHRPMDGDKAALVRATGHGGASAEAEGSDVGQRARMSTEAEGSDVQAEGSDVQAEGSDVQAEGSDVAHHEGLTTPHAVVPESSRTGGAECSPRRHQQPEGHAEMELEARVSEAAAARNDEARSSRPSASRLSASRSLSPSDACVVGVMTVAQGGHRHTTKLHASGGTWWEEALDDGGCDGGPLLKDDTGVHKGGEDDGAACRDLEGGESVLDRPALYYAYQRKALVSTVAYMFMRLTVIGLDDAMPLFMSTPRVDGGMAMTSNQIGLALFGQGILLVAHVLFIFPYLKERMGTLQLFWCSAAAIPVACFLLPFMSDLLPYVPSWFLYICVELYLGLKVMSFATGFTCVTVLINNSAPARVIGTVNGISQTAAAFASTIAPTLAGSAFSWSLQNGMPFPFDFHFTFFLFSFLGLGLAGCAYMLPPSIAHRYVE